MLRALALLLLAALLAGGCASGRVREANGYVDAVNRAQSSFTAQSQELLGRLEPGGPSGTARTALQRFSTVVTGFVAQLRAITPPARVRALHGRLIATMEGFGRSLRSAGAALVSGNALRVLDGQQELAQASATARRSLDRTLAAINAALRS